MRNSKNGHEFRILANTTTNLYMSFYKNEMQFKYLSILLLSLIGYNSISLTAQHKILHFGAHLNVGINFHSNSDVRILTDGLTEQLAGGIDLAIDIRKRIQLKLSVLLNYQHIALSDYRVGLPINPAPNHVIDFENDIYAKEDYQLRYVGLGIESKYYLSKKSSSFYAKIGFDNLINTGTGFIGILKNYNGGGKSFFQSFINTRPRKYVLHLKSGIGYEFCYGFQSKFFIEAQVRYTATQPFLPGYISIEEFNARIFSPGINVGFIF